MTTGCTRAVTFLMATLLIATSCSTYSGQKLGKKADNTEVVAEGVPYNLVRAEYKISRAAPAAGAKDPTYTLAVTYVPDSSQRYSLKIRPGALKNPDFSMTFGAGGILSGTKTTVTEQVTPFITAVASFAASVIGAATTFGVFDKTTLRQELAILLKDECKDPSDAVRFGMTPGAKVSEELSARISSFKDDDTFLAQFHYLTSKEKGCLLKVLGKIDAEEQRKTHLAEWEAAKSAFGDADDHKKTFVGRVQEAVNGNDPDALEAIGKEVAATAVMGNLPPEGLEKQKLLVAAKRARRAMAQSSMEKALKAFIDADAATWRARHVLFLERQMEQVGLLLLQRSLSAADAEKELARLRSERALTMGTVELQKRADALATFIESIKDKSVEGGTAPATAEYATARAELDAVNAVIDARRARILADAAPPAPPAIAPFSDVAVERVTAAYVEASKLPADAPKYVLVLQEDK